MQGENEADSSAEDRATEPGDYVVDPGDYVIESARDDADTVVVNTEAYSDVATYDAYPDDAGLDDEYSAPIADADGSARGRDRVNWPTVALAAGIAGIVSALVLAIAMVGLLLSDAAASNRAVAAVPQVVNLGAATLAPAAAAPAATAPPATAQPVSAEAAPVAAANSATTTSAAVVAATAPSLAQFQSDLAVLRSGASNRAKGELLEGGAPAAATLAKVLNYGKQFEPMGMGYRLVGPVKPNGTTATARLELYAPGYQSNYLPMTFVWKDGRWKLTNESVCELASFAQVPCNVR